MEAMTGKFVWYELMTSDAKAAETFYCKVAGWDAKCAGKDYGDYRILSAGTHGVGGLMPIPEDARRMGARPAWIGYIAVGDVDACVLRVKDAGGSVIKPPEDIPAVGRFSVVADPQGAAFVLFKASSSDAPPAPAPGTPGTIGWHELHAGDRERALSFYTSLFGWRKQEAHDMGPMGLYQLFATGDGPAVGGIMTKTPDTPVAHWLFYVNVDGADAALGRVREAGGQVLNGPMQVPGGSWILDCRDPQGARFALVASRR
jgi:predicted enzyme related to lactoylglutathione lyase